MDLAEIAKQNLDAEKAEDAEDAAEEITIIDVVKPSSEEVEDEVVPDSEYELKTPPIDDSTKTESNPRKDPPPPVRNRRGLGGIDYYKLSYDDPIFDN